MKTFLLIIITFFIHLGAFAQQEYTSINNTTANWTDYVWSKSYSWMSDRPKHAGNNSASPGFGYWHRVNLYGYITRNGDLTVNDGAALHVYDTLRIIGDLISKQTINIHSGGVLIVEGDYLTDTGGINTVGGKVVVLGDMSVANGASIDIGSGDFYISGNITSPGTGESFNGSSTPPSGYFKDESQLQTDEEDLFNFANGNPLPVDLVDYKLENQENSTIKISWKTASELNNDYFIIERSSDGVLFTEIGKIKGHGTTNQTQAYFFFDSSPLKGKAYYRLKQVDYDGTTEYKAIAAVTIKQIINDFGMYPNPANEVITIYSSAELNGVTILDTSGNTNLFWNADHQSFKKEKIDISSLKKGIYLLRFDFADGQREVKRLMVR